MTNSAPWPMQALHLRLRLSREPVQWLGIFCRHGLSFAEVIRGTYLPGWLEAGGRNTLVHGGSRYSAPSRHLVKGPERD